jgi:hypothetical protein
VPFFYPPEKIYELTVIGEIFAEIRDWEIGD